MPNALDQDTYYVISLRRPEGVSSARMRRFIKDAVETWAGQLDPESDPLSGFTKCSVRRAYGLNGKKALRTVTFTINKQEKQ